MPHPTPEISVVIPAVNSLALLRRTLAALAKQPRPEALEIVAVDRLPPADSDALRRQFPEVRIVPGSGLTIPRMRAAGIRAARGPIVAILEDHMEVARTWQEAILLGHAGGAAAVWGSVTNGCFSAVDWAAFFTEYSEHMTPVAEESAPGPPGNNVSYKRAAIEACGDAFFSGGWETFVPTAFARRGLLARCVAGAEAVHAKPFSVSHFVSQRWHISRSYAGMRAKGLSWPRRIVSAAAAPLLLPLRAWRIVRSVARRRETRPALPQSLPWIVAFLAVRAAGDAAGYVLGEGGSTLKVV
ncbi:MAG: glycosyltransferase family 2 protein [Acidobacteriota bacterium]|nr:glycosyltransferase family 2 protein [Acidobacteriota bacterium]